MYLYLIRHGQSTNNAIGADDSDEFERLRHHDPRLTEQGQAQAAQLGEYLQDLPRSGIVIDRLYTSAMRRALQTTVPVAKALNTFPQVWLDIHETGGMYLASDNGRATGYPGITRTEFLADFPGWEPPGGLSEAGWWDATRGEETVPETVERARRVAAALQEMAQQTPDANIALVSHGAFLDRLIRALLDLPMPTPDNRKLFYAHNNTGITKISFTPRWGTLVEYLNRVEHLPASLYSW